MVATQEGGESEQLRSAADELLACCPEVALLLDPGGLVLGASQAAEALFGDLAQLRGTDVRVLCTLPRGVMLSSTTVTAPTPIHVLRADGWKGYFEFTAYPLPKSHPRWLFAVLRALPWNYERMRHMHRLTAVGALARAMAHDINNLLHMMMLSTEALACDAPSDKVGVWVQQIQTALEAARGLTRRMLDATRTGVEPRFQEAPLAPTVREALDVVNPLLGSAIVVREHTPSTALVRHDPEAIFQLLLNLLVNARQAMPQGGAIDVRVEDVDDGDAVVRLSVVDQGVGMDEETKARVFERFFTTSDEGTGLGLSTVAEIAHRHGAIVSVSSAPGEGSRFDLLFPQLS